jgi:dTDP-4-amino-4,6-dideoxygalactose transaminase
MTVRFLDLSCSEDEAEQYCAQIKRILKSGQILNGPEVEQFEKEVRGYTGARFALGVGSGTSAIYVALKALDIGEGDEVITSALAFPGTANAIASTGATPVFVDVGPDMLIDPQAIDDAITFKTVAVMPVHFTGQICDMDALKTICGKRNLLLVEDAAPAFGARYRGQHAGTFGVMGCFSCNSMKILASVGEAGVILTYNETLYEQMVLLRYHGIKNKDTCVRRSINNRLDTIQAAVLSTRLGLLWQLQQKRQAIADQYAAGLGEIVRVPNPPNYIKHAWCHYAIRCNERDMLAQRLAEQGIETRIYHPKIMAEHPAYRSRLAPFPIALAASKEILCLPMHQHLTEAEVDHVIAVVRSFYTKTAAAA